MSLHDCSCPHPLFVRRGLGHFDIKLISLDDQLITVEIANGAAIKRNIRDGETTTSARASPPSDRIDTSCKAVIESEHGHSSHQANEPGETSNSYLDRNRPADPARIPRTSVCLNPLPTSRPMAWANGQRWRCVPPRTSAITSDRREHLWLDSDTTKIFEQ